MQRRVVGVYLIEIEKSESEYSLFANVDGNRLLLLYCSENELNKLTDSEILEMVNFKNQYQSLSFLHVSLFGGFKN